MPEINNQNDAVEEESPSGSPDSGASNSNKIKIIIAVIIIILGGAFLVYALFFNRATLEITAEAPFNLTIEGLRTENCLTNTCQTTLVPGQYQITVSKTGFISKAEQVELTRGQTLSKTYQLRPETKLQAIGDWNPPALNSARGANWLDLNLNIKSTVWTLLGNYLADLKAVQNFQISSDGSIFLLDDGQKIDLYNLDGKNQKPQTLPLPSGSPFILLGSGKILFLADSNQNQPTLFYTGLADFSKSLSVTSFVRKITQAKLMALSDLSKIALLDQSDPQNIGLYIIDTKQNTRRIFDQGPGLLDFRWINAKQFLLQKRNPVTFATEIYLGDTDTGQLQNLNLSLALKQIALVNSSQLLFAQALQAGYSATDVAALNNSAGFDLLLLDLNKPAAPDKVYTVNDLALPAKIQYDDNLKLVYLLVGNTIYSLNLEF